MGDNYSKSENEVIDKYLEGIGLTAFGVYSVLKRHMNNKSRECFPSIELIAKKCGCNRKTVMRMIKVLELNNLISVDRKKKHPNNYYINHVSRVHLDTFIKPFIEMNCPVCDIPAVHSKDSMVCPKCLMDVGGYVEDVLGFHFPDVRLEDIYGKSDEKEFTRSQDCPDSYYERLLVEGDHFPTCEPYVTKDVVIDFYGNK
jgi:hypothetical protein